VNIKGITEDDIANFLTQTPGFFERHAELLATVQLTSPHGQRAVSLQERQMQMLRDKIKGLEQKIIEMIRHGQDNASIADRLYRWTRAILLTTDLVDLPDVVINELKHEFMIPQAALRVWGADEPFQKLPFAQGASAEVRNFASDLVQPYCGVNSGFEAACWLNAAATVQSLAMIALRQGAQTGAFGLIVLGSPDPTRFAADMGTEFLARIGEIASAGLARLLPG
jgi:uncharacterized protein YigA (DUF484 family)